MRACELTSAEQSRRFRARRPDYDSAWAKRNDFKHQKAWKARNKQSVNSYTRKRQALILTTSVEFVDYAIVIRRADGICQICGEPFGVEKIEVDHIVPLAKGGAHTYENVQAAHRACNKRKGASYECAAPQLVLA